MDNSRVPLEMSPLPDGPWLELSMDLMDLPNGKYLLVIMDDYSRFPIVEHLHASSSQAVITALDRVLSTFGIPEVIRSDNGPCFTSAEFESFAKYLGFEHRRVTPRWPRANGEAECMMKTLKKIFRISRFAHRSFAQELQKFLRNYRATPHSTTG